MIMYNYLKTNLNRLIINNDMIFVILGGVVRVTLIPWNRQHGVTLSPFPHSLPLPIYATPRPTNFQLSTLSHSLPFLLLFLSTLFPFTSHPPFPLSLQNPFLSTLFALSLAPCTPRASKTPLEGHWPSSNRLPPRGSLRFSATRLYSSWGLRFWSLVCLSPGSVLRFCLGRSLGALLGPLGSSSLPPTLLL